MATLEQLETDIALLKERNNRVEMNKAWETSYTRRASIIIVTYIVVVAYFFIIHVDRPFLNAIVPVLGFSISTLSVSLIKKIWISKMYK